jgi:hypothetical protein
MVYYMLNRELQIIEVKHLFCVLLMSFILLQDVNQY